MFDLFLTRAPSSLDLFRIAFGAVLLFDLIRFWRLSDMIVGRNAALSYDAFSSLSRRSWTLFQYDRLQGRMIHVVFALGVLAAIFFMVGLATKIALVIAWVVLISTINRNREFSNSGHALAAILLFFCALSPIGSSLSVDARVPALAKYDAGWRWAMLACQLQITLMYLASVYQKLQHRDWREGTMMYKVTSYGLQRTAVPMPKAFAVLGVSKALTYSVLVAEVVFPLMLWYGPTAPIAIALLAALHLSMSLYLDVGTFPFYAIAGTLLFLPMS